MCEGKQQLYLDDCHIRVESCKEATTEGMNYKISPLTYKSVKWNAITAIRKSISWLMSELQSVKIPYQLSVYKFGFCCRYFNTTQNSLQLRMSLCFHHHLVFLKYLEQFLASSFCSPRFWHTFPVKKKGSGSEKFTICCTFSVTDSMTWQFGM